MFNFNQKIKVYLIFLPLFYYFLFFFVLFFIIFSLFFTFLIIFCLYFIILPTFSLAPCCCWAAAATPARAPLPAAPARPPPPPAPVSPAAPGEPSRRPSAAARSCSLRASSAASLLIGLLIWLLAMF